MTFFNALFTDDCGIVEVHVCFIVCFEWFDCSPAGQWARTVATESPQSECVVFECVRASEFSLIAIKTSNGRSAFKGIEYVLDNPN